MYTTDLTIPNVTLYCTSCIDCPPPNDSTGTTDRTETSYYSASKASRYLIESDSTASSNTPNFDDLSDDDYWDPDDELPYYTRPRYASS